MTNGDGMFPVAPDTVTNEGFFVGFNCTFEQTILVRVNSRTRGEGGGVGATSRRGVKRIFSSPEFQSSNLFFFFLGITIIIVAKFDQWYVFKL